MALRPVDIGFAEFVATLLSETVDSVVASATDQEQRHAELRAAARLSPGAFASAHVSEGEIDQLGVSLFGARIEAGAAAPAAPALDALGIELGAGDTDSDTLTDAGAERVRATLADRIGGERQRALRAALDEGLPKVVVDDGRLVAKVTMQVITDIDSPETSDAADPAGDDPAGGATVADAGTTGAVAAAPALSTTGARGAVGAVDVGSTIRAAGFLRPVSPLTERHVALATRAMVTGTGGDTTDTAGPTGQALIGSGLLARNIPSAIRDLRLAVRPAGTSTGDDDATTASLFGEVEIRFRTVFT